MEMKTGRNIFKSLLLSLALAVSFTSVNVYAAPACVDVFQKQALPFNVKANRAYTNAKYTNEQIDLVNSVLRSKGLSQVRTKDAAEVANQLVAILETNNYTGKKATDVIGAIALKVHPKLSNRFTRKKRQIMSSLVEAVSHFEAWRPEQYLESTDIAMITKDTKFLRLEELAPYVESYVKQDGGIYETGIPEDGAGILGFQDIRDAASNNLWVVEFKGHDIRHAHFLIGHPYAANAYFRAARSSYAKRYTIMGGLFEGVDTAQYGWESRITSYFRRKKMSLEEAMLYMGMIPQSKVEKLAQQLSLANEYGYPGALSTYESYQPKTSAQFPQSRLDQTLRQTMEFSYDLINDPSKAWLTNYNRAPRVGGERVDNETIQGYDWY
jgi:hypothetical protein